jgi:hypothetical protein
MVCQEIGTGMSKIVFCTECEAEVKITSDGHDIEYCVSCGGESIVVDEVEDD